ncbi:cytochrome c biogenesis protein ResB [Noviherbaspirillum sp. ST9]|uniref:cytochrome c biogenesis protein ResB n=1 Tax=Noviherbaspirillum sp. ST9 TaxID=3401606 RepID=UPI003B58A3D1
MRFVLALASLKFTPVGLVLLGIASVAVYKFDHGATPWLALPLFLLAINLIAAVATNGVFRKQMPLLVFHLALIVLVILAAVGRLTYLKGNAEITEGAVFSGLKDVDAGPLHQGRIEDVAFINEGFDIEYMAGPILDRIANRVRWRDASGAERVAEIGHNMPLTLHGYRIYPTSNKGFAPVFAWRPASGNPMLAAVHLPSYPANASGQALAWRPAGAAEELWVMLDIAETLIAEDKPSHLRLPANQKIVLRQGQERTEMQPGDTITLPDGQLEYQGLRTWMGYRFYYDWTIPWMLAACAVGVLSLSWHFWRKFAATPWNRDNA